MDCVSPFHRELIMLRQPLSRLSQSRLFLRVRRKIGNLRGFATPQSISADPIIASALASGTAGNHAAALRSWDELIERHPKLGLGFAGRAGALRRLGRHDEADIAIKEGIRRFPNDAVLQFEAGWLLLDTRKFDGALALWRRVTSSAPHWPDGHVGAATALRCMARFDEADSALETALARFPDACFVFTNFAVNADERGDRQEALSRWRTVLSRFPNEPIAYAGVGAALKMVEHFEESNAILSEGMRRFPSDVNVAANHAHVAVHSRDWPEAMRRWAAVSALWPKDPVVSAGYAEALTLARRAHDIAAHAVNEMSIAEHGLNDEQAALRYLMLRFESLGANCELGFVQRQFGAEPLGLFRWAGITYDALLRALEEQLSVIGDEDQTELRINEEVREYFTLDRRYGVSMHAYIPVTNISAEEAMKTLSRRIKFLKEKMLESLTECRKIFVFTSIHPLDDQQLIDLHYRLCEYGPAMLLHVAPHESQEPGTVLPVLANLWRGSLKRTGYDGLRWDVDFDSWLTICQHFL